MWIGNTHQIKLIPFTTTQDGNGENIETEGTKFNVWAEILNPSGFKSLLNAQNQLGATQDFLIRFNFNLRPGVNWRVKYDNRVWAVQDIAKVKEKQFYYRITATSKGEF